MTERSETAAEQAGRVAHRAAQDAAVDIWLLHTIGEQRAAVGLVGEVWGVPGTTVLPSHIARAAEHAGNYLAGAYSGREVVGVCFGLLGLEEARLILHSHILGVAPPARGGGVGRALKLHQRAWAMERAIGTVTWTYDPLIVRNGYFNITKLGAEIVAYHPDFYGTMDDAVNAGDDSDRVTVAWHLAAARVVAATEGRRPAAGGVAADGDDAPVILDVGEAGAPIERVAGGPRLRCRVPRDVEVMRRDDPALARRWRRALRRTLGDALAGGYVVPAATREGAYLLERRAA